MSAICNGVSLLITALCEAPQLYDIPRSSRARFSLQFTDFAHSVLSWPDKVCDPLFVNSVPFKNACVSKEAPALKCALLDYHFKNLTLASLPKAVITAICSAAGNSEDTGIKLCLSLLLSKYTYLPYKLYTLLLSLGRTADFNALQELCVDYNSLSVGIPSITNFVYQVCSPDLVGKVFEAPFCISHARDGTTLVAFVNLLSLQCSQVIRIDVTNILRSFIISSGQVCIDFHKFLSNSRANMILFVENGLRRYIFEEFSQSSMYFIHVSYEVSDVSCQEYKNVLESEFSPEGRFVIEYVCQHFSDDKTCICSWTGMYAVYGFQAESLTQVAVSLEGKCEVHLSYTLSCNITEIGQEVTRVHQSRLMPRKVVSEGTLEDALKNVLKNILINDRCLQCDLEKELRATPKNLFLAGLKSAIPISPMFFSD